MIRFSTARGVWTNVVWGFLFVLCLLSNKNNYPDSVEVVGTVPHEAIGRSNWK